MRTRTVVLALGLTAAWLATTGCGNEDARATATSPTQPTAVIATPPVAGPTATGPAPGAGAPTGTMAAPGNVAYPPEDVSGTRAVTFPPRNEPYDFRVQLESKYRDGLRRNPVSSYVDIEGTVVWTQEYLRYRLNGCLHAEAVDKVLAQIDGRGIQSVCGAETPTFPPRDQPFDFRVRLEAKYRDGLRRQPTNTYVDTEGDIVWTQEYLRYRVSSCDHSTSVSKVFLQIDGRGVQPDCRPTTGGGGGGGGTTGPTYGRFDGYVAAFDYEGVTWTPSITGTAAILLTWPDSSIDLDLYLTTGSCSGYPPSRCTILAESARISGNAEGFTYRVRAGDSYHIYVDNFSFTRGSSFTLEVAVSPSDAADPTGGPEPLSAVTRESSESARAAGKVPKPRS